MYDIICAYTLADKEFLLKRHKFMQYFFLIKLHNLPTFITCYNSLTFNFWRPKSSSNKIIIIFPTFCTLVFLDFKSANLWYCISVPVVDGFLST